MLTDLFTEELMIKELNSTTKQEVLKEMVELLDQNNKLKNKKKFLKAVMKREAEFSTGIGMGVAIPHGKSNGVKEPALVFARSKAGIDYDSMDGNPAHLFFLIAVPESANDEHLNILSMLSRKLMHEEVRQKLLNASSYDEIISIIN